MASLKTLRLKKLENLNAIEEVVEGRTYYVESNNTLYRDVMSTRVAVGKVYFAPDGITKLGEKNTLTLSNVLVISNEKDVDSDEPVYKIGMYDENGVYIDLSAQNKADLIDGKVPLDQLPELEEHDVIINLQQNKADLIAGKVPLEQLPELEAQKELVISDTEPTDLNIEMWVKLTGEEIIL